MQLSKIQQVMLKIWEPIEDDPFDGYELVSRWEASLVRDTASHVLAMLGYEDDQEKDAVVGRALCVCRTMHIPITQHFRKVYVQSPEGLKEDFLVTDLGCYLLTVNANAQHPAVGCAQVYFLTQM